MEKEIALTCDHCAAIQEIGRVHEVASQFMKEILKLNSSTLSRLQSIAVNGGCCCSNSSGEHKRKRLETTTTDSQKIYIRRRKEETLSAVTTEPYHDGHQWRKYGKKTINNAKYQRSYYRCIHKEEEGCSAKKTIQQIEEDGRDEGETAASRFSVEYIGRHTCKLSAAAAAGEVLLEPFVMESTTAPISNYSTDHSRISSTETTGSSGSNSIACCSSSAKPADDALVASVLVDQTETVGEDDHDMEDYWKVFSPIHEGSGWDDWEYTDDYVPLGNEYNIW